MIKPLPIFLVTACLGTCCLWAEGDRSRLVGVWRYQGEVDTRSDGSPAPPGSVSPEGEGFLLYREDGWMSVNIMPKGRTWDTGTATLEELRDTLSNGTAYSGRYEVDEATHTVTHIPQVCMEPGYQGKRLARTYRLQGDTLELSGTFEYQGKSVRFTVTWARERATAPAASTGEQIQRLIQERLSAYEKRDADAWALHVDDDCLCAGQTKTDLRAAILARPAAVRNGFGEISGLQVRDLGDFALATYRVTEFSEIGRQRIETELARTETFRLREGVWKLIAGADVVIPKDPTIAEISPDLYGSYVGQYEYATGLRDTVSREGNRLWIQSSGQGKEEIFPENESTFFARRQAWRMVFTRNDQGKVTALIFRQDGQDLVARRVEEGAP